jgi:hypothetical protein
MSAMSSMLLRSAAMIASDMAEGSFFGKMHWNNIPSTSSGGSNAQRSWSSWEGQRSLRPGLSSRA